MRKLFNFLILLSILFVITGCTQPKTSVTIPNFKQEYKSKKKIIIVPPQIKMYEISAAGEEEIVEWTKQATVNMKNSISSEISNKNILNNEILDLTNLSKTDQESVINTQNLMYRVGESINFHALETSFYKFNNKMKNFDYKIGDQLANISQDGDLYLFINGFDKVQSSGKKAVETAKLIIGAIFGVAAGDIGGITYSNITLVDGKTGKILWYKYYFSKGAVDLRTKEGTDVVIKDLLNDLQNYI